MFNVFYVYGLNSCAYVITFCYKSGTIIKFCLLTYLFAWCVTRESDKKSWPWNVIKWQRLQATGVVLCDGQKYGMFTELYNCPFLNLPLNEVKSKRVQNCLNCHCLKMFSWYLQSSLWSIFYLWKTNYILTLKLSQRSRDAKNECYLRLSLENILNSFGDSTGF